LIEKFWIVKPCITSPSRRYNGMSTASNMAWIPCGSEYFWRARCGKSARRDLWGGCWATVSPTAMASPWYCEFRWIGYISSSKRLHQNRSKM